MGDTPQQKKLFCFGLGFTGSALVNEVRAGGWATSGTCRENANKNIWDGAGVSSFRFDGREASESVENAVREASHVLVTIPPQKESGDVVLKHFKKILKENI